MTAINDVSTNNMDFKRLDTTKDIIITPIDKLGNPVQLNTSHTWTAKVSDETNYIGNYPVTFESNNIRMNSSDFTKLPAGHYHLEVWEEWTDANGDNQRSIYPSPKETISFRIYSNVTDLAEKEIKTIGFQDVVDQAVMNIGLNYVFKVNVIEPDQTATVVQTAADGKNYVTFNIPKGDKGDKGDVGPIGPKGDKGDTGLQGKDGAQGPKGDKGDTGLQGKDGAQGPKGDKGDTGDTGTVDNTGLISAPAFQSLQTQVNNSAVGTNLYTDTKNFDNLALWRGSNFWTKTSDTYKGLAVMQTTQDWGGLSQYVQVKKGDILTYSVYAKNTSGTGTSDIYWTLTSQTEGGYSSATTNIISNRVTVTDSWQRLSGTVVATGDGYLRPRLERAGGTTNTMQIAGIKLEKGSVATDWCPNPSDILTQSDYAKIQAAIIALGGSLK